MGIFISSLCGPQRRSRSRANSDSNIRAGRSLHNENEEIILYRAECEELHLPEIQEDYGQSTKMGMALKRKNFKWRLDTNVPKEELTLKKQIFWDTCSKYGGQPQVWDALKLICQDTTDDIELFRSILESCGVILPYGQLTEIYDSKGFRYHLPPYCVCDPIDLHQNYTGTMKIQNDNADGTEKLKVRLSDGKDFPINIEPHLNVYDLKQFVRKQENFDEKRRMVVLWCGKVLEDKLELKSLNLPKGAVLQVMLP